MHSTLTILKLIHLRITRLFKRHFHPITKNYYIPSRNKQNPIPQKKNYNTNNLGSLKPHHTTAHTRKTLHRQLPRFSPIAHASTRNFPDFPHTHTHTCRFFIRPSGTGIIQTCPEGSKAAAWTDIFIRAGSRLQMLTQNTAKLKPPPSPPRGADISGFLSRGAFRMSGFVGCDGFYEIFIPFAYFGGLYGGCRIC